MRYRDHRGSLDESMKTVKEFYTIEELKQHLNKSCNKFGKSVKTIKFMYAGFDERINWHTFYVIQIFEDETDPKIVGMSDGFLY